MPDSHLTSEPVQTPLYQRHVDLGAKMVPFAGWLMPIQYSGILNEHRTVRSAAGLFDLGHMGQVAVSGPQGLDFLQLISSNDVSVLGPGEAQYGLLTNPAGGVIDDIIVYRQPDGNGFMVVINAANAAKDVAWMQQQQEAHPELEFDLADISPETGMIAIQGPTAQAITQTLTDLELAPLPGFSIHEATVSGIPVSLARTGYTGEDGFEIYCDIDRVGELWDALMVAGEPHGLIPVGLGARDSLRLEARMPLYGNELADDISPLEAGLGWAVKLDKPEFVGKEPIAAQKEAGVPRKTVGIKLTERSGAPRHGCEVQVDGKTVGIVTSGGYSPTLEENIALALIESGVAGVGKPADIVIREKAIPGVQVKVPFYKRSKADS